MREREKKKSKRRKRIQKKWKSALSDYTEMVALRKVRAEFGTFYQLRCSKVVLRVKALGRQIQKGEKGI